MLQGKWSHYTNQVKYRPSPLGSFFWPEAPWSVYWKTLVSRVKKPHGRTHTDLSSSFLRCTAALSASPHRRDAPVRTGCSQTTRTGAGSERGWPSQTRKSLVLSLPPLQTEIHRLPRGWGASVPGKKRSRWGQSRDKLSLIKFSHQQLSTFVPSLWYTHSFRNFDCFFLIEK